MRKINLQDLASYVAVIVAAVALYVGWDQARIGRNQQHADVFPVIQIISDNIVVQTKDGNTARRLMLKAANAGVGPAFIESGKWSIDGTDIKRVADISALMPEGLAIWNEYQGIHENFLLAAGEEFIIWEVSWPNDAKSRPLSSEFLNKFWEMDLELCYCSLYERCWVSKYNAEKPRPEAVKVCPADESKSGIN